MAARGILGLTRTIPRGEAAGCQVGGPALLGIDPVHHRVGAAALEALGVGVDARAVGRRVPDETS
jgi:2,3-bisphosphoglycerate-independent phosphoglycerate mutase